MSARTDATSIGNNSVHWSVENAHLRKIERTRERERERERTPFSNVIISTLLPVTLPLSRENNVNSHARIARFNRLSQFSFRRLRYPFHFPPIDYEFIKVPSRLNRSVAPEGNLVVAATLSRRRRGKKRRATETTSSSYRRLRIR